MSDFRPSRWLWGPHFQTIGGRYVRRSKGATFRRERIELEDGDFVDIDFVEVDGADPTTLDDRSPVCLVLHGLEGSSRAGYAIETYRRLAHQGVRPIGFNFRGCGGQPNRLAQSYHSGASSDPAMVLEWLRARIPNAPMGAIGFSLGGNVLLKYLGERGATAAISAAAVVSVPFDLAACSDALSQGFSRVYSRHLLGSLQTKLTARRGLVEAHCDFDRGLDATDFRTFDDAITAPIHGFASADDYYRTCSSGAFLDRIQVPTALVQAQDDPFVPATSIPRGVIATNRFLTPRIVARGGHVGFVHGPPWRPRFWAENTAATFVARQLLGTADRAG